ncbi:MAG: hypothetical protein ABIH00_11650 [Armatimonadota bacterium]
MNLSGVNKAGSIGQTEIAGYRAEAKIETLGLDRVTIKVGKRKVYWDWSKKGSVPYVIEQKVADSGILGKAMYVDTPVKLDKAESLLDSEKKQIDKIVKDLKKYKQVKSKIADTYIIALDNDPKDGKLLVACLGNEIVKVGKEGILYTVSPAPEPYSAHFKGSLTSSSICKNIVSRNKIAYREIELVDIIERVNPNLASRGEQLAKDKADKDIRGEHTVRLTKKAPAEGFIVKGRRVYFDKQVPYIIIQKDGKVYADKVPVPVQIKITDKEIYKYFTSEDVKNILIESTRVKVFGK